MAKKKKRKKKTTKKRAKKKAKKAKKKKKSKKRPARKKKTSKKKTKKRTKKKVSKKKKKKAQKKTSSLPSLEELRAAIKADPFHEKRTHPRIPLKIKIDYFKDPGVFLYDYSRNLGRGGLFIETKDPMSPGTEIRLSFTLPEQDDPIEVVGRVAWIHRVQQNQTDQGVPGMGIQFNNPSGENKERLDRFFREIDYDNLSF